MSRNADGLRCCQWCGEQLPTTTSTMIFCSRKHRQAAWRARRLWDLAAAADTPLRFAYADPPYPGFAARLYKDQPSYAGEVDHAALLSSLQSGYDGWALSTGAYALREILPLCPKEARVCAWVKPHGVSSRTRGLHNAWEPLIVVPGRKLRPGKRDWLSAYPARCGGTLMGRKPVKFCCWLFDCLGMLAGDTLEDLFPGTGIVARSWAELNRPRPSPRSTSDGFPLFDSAEGVS